MHAQCNVGQSHPRYSLAGVFGRLLRARLKLQPCDQGGLQLLSQRKTRSSPAASLHATSTIATASLSSSEDVPLPERFDKLNPIKIYGSLDPIASQLLKVLIEEVICACAEL